MNLKLVITDAFLFFRYHFRQIATLCLPWLLAVAIVEYLVSISSTPAAAAGEEGNPLQIISLGFYLIIYPIYTAALILLMAKRAKNETPNNRELLSLAMQTWQPLFILNLIVAGILYPAIILAFQGLALFLIPAVFVAVRLSFAEFYLVLEEVKPLEAIRTSFRATRPYFFHILLLLFLFVIPFWSVKIVRAQFFSTAEIDPVTNIVSGTVIAFLSLFVDVLMFRLYMSATQEQQT